MKKHKGLGLFLNELMQFPEALFKLLRLKHQPSPCHSYTTVQPPSLPYTVALTPLAAIPRNNPAPSKPSAHKSLAQSSVPRDLFQDTCHHEVCVLEEREKETKQIITVCEK